MDAGEAGTRALAPADGATQREAEAACPPQSAAAATTAAAATAATAAAEAEPALESCLSDLDNDSDITGTMSGDEQQDKMDIDKMVSTIPKEQREGVRAMLEKSKSRRMRQLQRRLKKPITEEPAIPRNPKK